MQARYNTVPRDIYTSKCHFFKNSIFESNPIPLSLFFTSALLPHTCYVAGTSSEVVPITAIPEGELSPLEHDIGMAITDCTVLENHASQ